MKGKALIKWMIDSGAIHKYNIAVSLEFLIAKGELTNQDDIDELYTMLALEEQKTLYELLELTLVDYTTEDILDKNFVNSMLNKFLEFNKITQIEYDTLVAQL